MREKYPKRPGRIRFQELPEENELMLVDEEKGQARVLNADAGGVWLLCNGKRSEGDMAAVLKGVFPKMPDAEIRERLNETLAFLREQGLLE
jgi:hypothetical protein